MAPPRVHNEVGSLPRLGIRHLLGEDRLETLRRHSGPGEDPLALDGRRSADHENCIAAGFPSGLEEKRNVQDHQGSTRSFGPGQEGFLFATHQRVEAYRWR